MNAGGQTKVNKTDVGRVQANVPKLMVAQGAEVCFGTLPSVNPLEMTDHSPRHCRKCALDQAGHEADGVGGVGCACHIHNSFGFIAR